MNVNDGEVDRREFLKDAAKAAAGIAAVGSIASTADANSEALASEAANVIASRAFGKTGLKLPVLGFGGAALPTVWGNPLSTEKRVELMR